MRKRGGLGVMGRKIMWTEKTQGKEEARRKWREEGKRRLEEWEEKREECGNLWSVRIGGKCRNMDRER